MISAIKIKNLTVFSELELTFSSGLNVIVGENGTGKSHLLKVMYSLMATSASEGKKPTASSPTKSLLQSAIAEKLIGVMRPESVGRLARRKQGRERCEIEVKFQRQNLNIHVSFATNSKSEVSIETLPTEWIDKAPVYLPTRELLSIYPGFVSIYEGHYLEFEETWRDTCILLGALLQKGPTEHKIKSLLKPLEEAMGGSVVLDNNGRFYLSIPKQGTMEIPLVAEGIRKLAMVARLIATGSLMDKGVLFWDEPETNLNPRLIKHIAQTIMQLAKNGIQVFVASHSLFLLRELDILSQEEFTDVPTQFFGLLRSDDNVNVIQGNSIDEIGDITALDEEIEQSDRYMEMNDANS